MAAGRRGYTNKTKTSISKRDSLMQHPRMKIQCTTQLKYNLKSHWPHLWKQMVLSMTLDTKKGELPTLLNLPLFGEFTENYFFGDFVRFVCSFWKPWNFFSNPPQPHQNQQFTLLHARNCIGWFPLINKRSIWIISIHRDANSSWDRSQTRR